MDGKWYMHAKRIDRNGLGFGQQAVNRADGPGRRLNVLALDGGDHIIGVSPRAVRRLGSSQIRML